MEDLYTAFIELSLQQCSSNDYTNRQKVRIHNVATKKLIALKQKMLRHDCSGIILKLLNEPEDHVKLNAAAFCVENNLLFEQGKYVLFNLCDESSDASVRFSAQMILNQIEQNKEQGAGLRDP